ncbi:MAG: hypothetical protein Q9217_003505 [Psora testacea]
MIIESPGNDASRQQDPAAETVVEPSVGASEKASGWRRLGRSLASRKPESADASENEYDDKRRPEKWSMGVLNDKETEEVPGSVLLMSNSKRNEPLGLRNAPARTSASSLPSPFLSSPRASSTRPSLGRRHSELSVEEKKRTADGKIILEPQPEDTLNDPLNWPTWRRDVALLSLGFYCMMGGGMTPVLAAGFQNVADSYNVTIPQVALTTGLYMMGLGLGSVIASPTAIIWGKRPVYLVVIARIFMGFAVSPCECLPSATIAEIFYLHERAYRLGIYTLLLLSGKNLLPLVSASIIQGLNWRWVFWIIAMVVGFCFVLMLLFVPETFWDRTPRPHKGRKTTLASISAIFHHPPERKSGPELSGDAASDMRKVATGDLTNAGGKEHATIAERRRRKHAQHVGFADQGALNAEASDTTTGAAPDAERGVQENERFERSAPEQVDLTKSGDGDVPRGLSPAVHKLADRVVPRGEGPQTPGLHNFNSPYYVANEKKDTDYWENEHEKSEIDPSTPNSTKTEPGTAAWAEDSPVASTGPDALRYTTFLRTQPRKTFLQTLKPWNGKLRHENWFLVGLRPFILFAYPAILWSTLVYSLSIGWLIVLSESVSIIYKEHDSYNFTSLQTGLVYISPFIGGIMGTAVAGKVSDIIVRFMSRRNGGVYEPEFRLVMAIPVTISTCVGLMGFGWSAQERDNWIVPTIFFGIISFGCSLGSTTSITFAVDSYRQYAGEALVTLNFAKNIFHGLVFSLFFNHWLEADGSKNTFVAIGGIQLACLLTTIPMYIYGKRARMWTVRKNLMEKF